MQQKMADYRQPAPEVSWEELDKALANNKPKAKTVPMWMRRIAAAVVALVVVTAGYLALNRNHEDGASPLIGEAASAQGTYSPVRSPKTPLLAVVTPKLQSHKKEEQTIESQTTQTVEPQEEPSIPQSQESQPQETGEPQNTHHTRTVVETPQRQTLDYPSAPQHQKASVSGSRLMAKVYLSNGLAGSNNFIRDNSYSGEFSNNTDKSQPTGQTQNNYNNSSNLNLTHHQPVRFGLSLRYRLDDKWSIESGLTYTRLRSDLKWINTEQTLSYVGIPVNANYLLWGNRHVNFYVSAGGMVEKMVKGRRETTYNGSKWEKDVSIHPLQFSINGGIGMEFNLTNQFSIYAEPGMGYYFDNGSDVPTYYQDTPFSFNLNLGLRFNLK